MTLANESNTSPRRIDLIYWEDQPTLKKDDCIKRALQGLGGIARHDLLPMRSEALIFRCRNCHAKFVRAETIDYWKEQAESWKKAAAAYQEAYLKGKDSSISDGAQKVIVPTEWEINAQLGKEADGEYQPYQWSDRGNEQEKEEKLKNK